MCIYDIIPLCKDDSIIVTEHFLTRCKERNITYAEAKEAIVNGTIIEIYENAYPYPSCLILGYTFQNRILHIVVAVTENKLWFITVYEPSLNNWQPDFKNRKE